jgi:Putative bacterial sensory transduction regulator
MALFSNKQEANLRSCIRMIEDALKSLGHPPDNSRSESDDDMPAWRVESGGVRVDVHLGITDEKNVLRVMATVATVPPGGGEARIFRKLLELNADEVKSVAFGLVGNDIVLVSERSTIDLDPSEVEDILRRIEKFAAHYAGVLATTLVTA